MAMNETDLASPEKAKRFSVQVNNNETTGPVEVVVEQTETEGDRLSLGALSVASR